MVKVVSIVRKDLCETLENMKAKMQADIDAVKVGTTVSYSDLIDSLLASQGKQTEVMITPEGRFEGSRALAGKTIFYRMIE